VLVFLEMAKSGRHPAIEIAVKTPRVTVCPTAVGTLEYELGFVVDAVGTSPWAVVEVAIDSPVDAPIPRVSFAVGKTTEHKEVISDIREEV
jgi:hypothetical protein